MLVLLFALAVVTAVRGMWSPCGLSMLSTLNPVSERARGHRFWATACWYVLGALAGGALLGCGCGALAVAFRTLDAPPPVVWTLTLAGSALAVASDARINGWSLPMHPRQVDERWVDRYRRWLYAAGYGVQIGTGFATYIMTAGVYLVALLAVLTGSFAQAFAGGVVFGLVRGLCIVVSAGGRTPHSLRVIIRQVEAWSRGSALVAAAACAGVGSVAAWELFGATGAAVVAVAFAVIVLQGARSASRGRSSAPPAALAR
jgi:hypothetical protein